MIKYRFILVLFVLSASVYSQTSLTVLYTNNINGTLENCLCPDHPLGSLEKMKVQIDQIRKNNGHVLLLDAGDLLSAFGNPEKDVFVLKTVKLFNYDALAVGDQEFVNGAKFFIQNFKKENLPFISTNLEMNKSKPWQPFVEKKIGGLSVLIISAVSKNAFQFYAPDKIDGLKINDQIKSINNTIADRKGKTDFVILLSHNGFEEDKQLAKKIKGVDLIIGGHSQNILNTPVKCDKTLIVQTGGDGYYLGKLDLQLNKKGKIKSYYGELIPMSIELPNDPNVVTLIKDFHFLTIQRLIQRGGLVKAIDKKYIVAAADKCASCHSREYNIWKKSPHSRSWKTLETDGKTRQLKCVSRHVSGFGRKDGFFNLNLTKNLAAVTCTECHNISAGHFKNPAKSVPSKVNKESCFRCHNNEKDAGFNFNIKREKILHKP